MLIKQLIIGYIYVARIITILVSILVSALLLALLITLPLWLLATSTITVYNWVFGIYFIIVTTGIIVANLITSGRRSKNTQQYLKNKIIIGFQVFLRLLIVVSFLAIECLVFLQLGLLIGIISFVPALLLCGLLIFLIRPKRIKRSNDLVLH